MVVDDGEADSLVVELGRNVEIRFGGCQVAGRMVVEQDGTGGKVSRRCEYSAVMTAGYHSRLNDTTLVIDKRGKTDFVAARAVNFGANQLRGRTRQLQNTGMTRSHRLSPRNQVLSVFFLAAGNNTLLSISR
jgi:hypothetical protein